MYNVGRLNPAVAAALKAGEDDSDNDDTPVEQPAAAEEGETQSAEGSGGFLTGLAARLAKLPSVGVPVVPQPVSQMTEAERAERELIYRTRALRSSTESAAAGLLVKEVEFAASGIPAYTGTLKELGAVKGQLGQLHSGVLGLAQNVGGARRVAAALVAPPAAVAAPVVAAASSGGSSTTLE